MLTLAPCPAVCWTFPPTHAECLVLSVAIFEQPVAITSGDCLAKLSRELTVTLAAAADVGELGHTIWPPQPRKAPNRPDLRPLADARADNPPTAWPPVADDTARTAALPQPMQSTISLESFRVYSHPETTSTDLDADERRGALPRRDGTPHDGLGAAAAWEQQQPLKFRIQVLHSSPRQPVFHTRSS